MRPAEFNFSLCLQVIREVISNQMEILGQMWEDDAKDQNRNGCVHLIFRYFVIEWLRGKRAY